MNYKDFKEYVNTKCIPEAIYEDTEGREILVITMLEAFNMMRWIETKRRPLTDEDIAKLMVRTWGSASIAPQAAPAFARAIERAHSIGGEE